MILDVIAEKTRERVVRLADSVPFETVRREAEDMARIQDTAERERFKAALRGQDIAFLCEVKKASPSKGVIATDFPHLQIAEEYQAAGAAAISVLTEPDYFQGSSRYLKEIAQRVSVPVLRKDFTVDPYQIFEARLLGASAVLLICALLPAPVLKEYLAIARELKLSALVEAHSEEEIETALGAGAEIIGVNNRDLKTFRVDITTSIRLRRMVPPEIVFVSESGMKTPEDIKRLRENGTDAVLIGEALMRSPDKAAMLAHLRGDSANGPC